MVKNSIKVYARLKQNDGRKKIGRYEICKDKRYEAITFQVNDGIDFFPNKPNYYKFRFHKIFDQTSTQLDVFDTIAKPVVNSAIHGFNGTIFAYGQTGSGKTYAITGSSEDYNRRGIIPRSIQEIFDFTCKSPEKYTIYISYLEIYNDIGYDLLNPKQHATKLEELPRVVLLEDAKGESHLRNLSVLPVCTEQEAMRLLFLGDTNRTIAETPLNEYSSRSHCIFTIYISTKSEKTGKSRRSKLHLVDLAGSERIHKSKISGTTLNEAKHINLSLHYLEQVILALSQSKRSHIPYRNSMMTYMLRDSLSGNCLTAMIATLALNVKNLEETITTCKFAQRVALISTEAVINEEIDPQQEIVYLRNEVEELRRQLFLLKGVNVTETLTHEQEKNCNNAVKNFLTGSIEELPVEGDMRQIRLCFKLLKEAVQEQSKSKLNEDLEIVNKYKEIIQKKDEEISVLTELLHTTKQSEVYTSIASDIEQETKLTQAKEKALELFTNEPKNRTEIDYYIQTLDKKYNIAKIFAETIEQCQTNIINLRKKLESCNGNAEIYNKINEQILSQQNIYRDSIVQLDSLKNETEHLKHGLERVKIKMMRDFKKWYEEKYQKTQSQSSFHESHDNRKPKPFSKTNKFTSSAEKFSYMFRPNDLFRTDRICKPMQLKSEELCQKDEYQERIKNFASQENHQDFQIAYPKSPATTEFDYKQYTTQNFGTNVKLHQLAIGNNENSYQSVQSPLKNTTTAWNFDICVEDEDNFSIGNNKSINVCNFDKIKDENKQITFPETSFAYLSENFLQECETFLQDSASSSNIYKCPMENLDSSKINSTNNDTQETSSMDGLNNFFKKTDSNEFIEFMKTIPLTGDAEVDDEIFNFYRSKFKITKEVTLFV